MSYQEAIPHYLQQAQITYRVVNQVTKKHQVQREIDTALSHQKILQECLLQNIQ